MKNLKKDIIEKDRLITVLIQDLQECQAKLDKAFERIKVLEVELEDLERKEVLRHILDYE